MRVAQIKPKKCKAPGCGKPFKPTMAAIEMLGMSTREALEQQAIPFKSFDTADLPKLDRDGAYLVGVPSLNWEGGMHQVIVECFDGMMVVHDPATVSCPSTDTAAVARGQTATRAAMVLSDLLTRADERAGELAQAYDRARIAGHQCEASYDALGRK